MKKYLKIFIPIISFVVLTLTGVFIYLGINNANKHIHEFNQMLIDDIYLKENATCTTKAKYYYSCDCGEHGDETFEYGEAKGHTIGEWYVSVDATCDSKGFLQRDCENCDYHERKETEKLDHDYQYISTSSTEEGEVKHYHCGKCGSDKEVVNYSSVYEVYTGNKFFDQPSDFKFLIRSDKDEDYIKSNLLIYDVAIDIEKFGDEGKTEFTLTKNTDYDNVWEVSANVVTYDSKDNKTEHIGYIDGSTYKIQVSDDISFVQYVEDEIYITIYSENKQEIKEAAGLKFLKTLEANNPGYGVPTVTSELESDYVYVTLNKIDGLKKEDIIVIGNITSLDDINVLYQNNDYAALDEILIGNINEIYEDQGKFILELSAPELSQVFEQLDINYSDEIEIPNDEEVVKNLEESTLNQFIDSEDFPKMLLSVNATAQNFASERGYESQEITEIKFTDFVNFKPNVSINGTTATIKLDVSLKDIKIKSKGKEIGSIKVGLNITTTVGFEANANYQLKYTRLFHIPYSIDYFDFSITQKDSFSVEFKVEIDIDYDMVEPEKQYWHNTASGEVHLLNCTHIKYANLELDHWEKIKDSEMIALCSNADGTVNEHECLHCKPYTRLNGSTFVYNKKNDVLHCYNCFHVSQMAEENKVMYYGSFSTLPSEVKKCNLCDWCQPQNASCTKHFEEDLLAALKYQDWGEKIDEIKNWIKSSESNEASKDITLFTFKLPIYIVTFNFDVKLHLSFKLNASLTINYKESHTNTYGVRLNGGLPKTYYTHSETKDGPNINITGSIDFKVGIKLEAYISLVGLSHFVKVGISADLGVYADCKGVVNITSNEDENNYYAARIEIGLYVDVSGFYKFLWWDGSYSIYNTKLPLIQLGYDKAYYGYANSLTYIDIGVDETYYELKEDELLNVLYYDVNNQKTGKEQLKFNSDLYNVALSLSDDTYCKIEDGKIVLEENAPIYFTTDLIINISDTKTFTDYVKGSSKVFLSELRVPIVRGYEHDCVYDVENVNIEYLVSDATCESPAIYNYSCACGEKGTETFSYGNCLGHSFTNYVSNNDATCTSDGTKTAKCDRCDATDTIIDEGTKVDHTFTNYVFNNDATCTSDGTKTAKCDHCDATDTITDISSMLSHTFDQQVTSQIYLVHGATCTEAAVYFYSCVCGAKGTETFSYGNQLGHSFINYVSNNDATCTSDGTKTAKCDRCNETDTIIDMSSKLSHTHDQQVIESIYLHAEASCTEKATYYYSCICGDVSTTYFEYGDLLEHEYVDSKCIHCGVTEYQFEFNSKTNTYTITSIGNCKDTVIEIPSTYNGYPVTAIEDFAFNECDFVTSIVIPNGIISIGNCAFDECVLLKNISLPDSILAIGYSAFRGCASLENITIPSNVTRIEDGVFKNCTSLVTITIHNNVTFIGSSAFSGCSKLTGVNIPKDVTAIGNSTFKDCISLETITFPNSLKEIGSYAFDNCNKLTSVTIPNSVTKIGNFAFMNCSSLESVTLSDNLEEFGKSVFNSCNKLIYNQDVDGYYLSSHSNNYYLFMKPKDSSTENVSIFNGCKWISNESFIACNNIKNITIPDSIVSIGTIEFTSLTNLIYNEYDGGKYLGNSANPYLVFVGGTNDSVTSFEVVEGCKYIAYRAFHEWRFIENVTIPQSVQDISVEAFANCYELEGVIIPAGIETIKANTFINCNSLNKITIPSSVVKIEVQAFSNCLNLMTIIYGGTKSEWEELYATYSWDDQWLQNRERIIVCSDGYITFKLTLIVHYISEGGTLNSPEYVMVEEGTELSRPQDPVKEGYMFMGWTTDYSGTYWHFVGFNVVSDMELIANWRENEYTITLIYDDNHTSDPQELRQAYGTPINVVEPTKTGYTFVGWSEPLPSTMPAKDMTLNAIWSINQYSITLRFNDESTEDLIITQDYNTPVIIDNPIREGYTFVRWNEELPVTMPAENRTIEAIWEVNQYTLTIVYNNGLPDCHLTRNYNSYFYIDELIANPVRKGYTFKGWTEELPVAMPAENKKIEAIWEVNQYTLTIIYNDDVTENLVITQDYNTPVVIDNPTREGYSFNGWNKEVPSYMPSEDLILEARWSIYRYTITFVYNNGYPDYYLTQEFNSYIYIDEPTKTGYTFDGWSEELPLTMPAEDKTIEAIWKVNQYTLTIKYNDGVSEDLVITQDYESFIELIADPVREGYTFNRWSEPIPTFMPLEGKTIEALWGINQYTITLKYNDGLTSDLIITQDYGTLIYPIDDPAWMGHIFEGWANSNGEVVTIPETMPAEDRQYNATWKEEKEYTLTIKLNDGVTEDLVFTQLANSLIECNITEPVKEGYCFDSWSETIPTLMPAENKVIEANWICHINYEIKNNKALVISSNNKVNDVVILDKYEGYETNKICDSAFDRDTRLTSIIIPDSVTSIGFNVFNGCTGLTNITIPNSVKTIGSSAFRECTSLTSITISDSVTSIEDSTFSGCAGLTNITIPNSVTSIGLSVFSGCRGLTSITIPFIGRAANDTKWLSYLFGGSSYIHNSYVPSALKEVIITRGVTIGEYTFYGCSNLTSIIIPLSVRTIQNSAFESCTSLTNITLPSSVIWIANKSFYNCTSLTSIIIPMSVTTIEDYAFSNCKKLTIYCETTKKPSRWSSDWNYSGRPVVWNYQAS